MALNLYISTKNPTHSALVRSVTSNTPVAAPEFTLGDTIPRINVYLTDGDGGYDSLAGTGTARLAIGPVGGVPTGGTFTITLGANTTSALAYNASAATVQTALNLLASVVSAGGCTVTGESPRWVVTFGAVGAVSAMTGSGTALTPSSGVSISELVAGTGSVAEVQLIRLARNPAAFQDTWTVISGQGWYASLSLATRELLDLVGTSGSLATTLEFEHTDVSGNRRTYLQVPCTVYNELIDLNAAVAVASGTSYLSIGDAQDQYVQNRSGITALTGGANTALDNIATVNKTVGWLACVNHSSANLFYRLESGTTAEAAPWTIRPDDYDGSTNAKIWNLQLATKNGNSLLWNPSDSKFYEHGALTLDGVVTHSISGTGILITS